MSAGKRILQVLSILMLIVLVPLLAANVYVITARLITGQRQPTVFGWSTAVVISGSMSGSIEIDDQVIIHRQDSYQKGDIIAFDTGSSLVSHRIYAVTEEGFITKGDANNAPDQGFVHMNQVIGKVVLVIPRVGMVVGFFKSPYGIASLIMIIALFIGAPILYKRLIDKESQDADQ